MFTTTIGKSGICPKWKVEVTISGKYVLSDEPGEEYIGRYMLARCPIVESSRLPLHKQDPKYKLMRCGDENTCPLMNSFPKHVDVRNGYTV